MKRIMTPIIIQKKDNVFTARFEEYPDVECIYFDSVEFLLDISSIYLALYMIIHNREFNVHNKPLTPPDDIKKGEIFSLIISDIDATLDILRSEEVSPSQMFDWIIQDSRNNGGISAEEKPFAEAPVPSQKKNLDIDEFELEFATQPAEVKDEPKNDKDITVSEPVTPEEPPAPEEPEIPENIPASSIHDKLNAIKKETAEAKDVFATINEDDGIDFIPKSNNKPKPNNKQNNNYKPKRQPPKKKKPYNNKPNNNKNTSSN